MDMNDMQKVLEASFPKPSIVGQEIGDDEWDAPAEVWKAIGEKYKDSNPLDHPLFCDEVTMHSLKEEGTALHAMVEIQKETLAEDQYGIAYMKREREHGNDFMKDASMAQTKEGLNAEEKLRLKKQLYGEAIKSYTNGLESAIEVRKIDHPERRKLEERSNAEGLLYANRSQAFILLDNYQDAFNDAKEACKRCRDNIKAHYRAAKCALHLQFYKDALHYSKLCLALDPKDPNTLRSLQVIQGEAESKLQADIASLLGNDKKTSAQLKEEAMVEQCLKNRQFKIREDSGFYAGGALSEVAKKHPLATCNCDEEDRVPDALHWSSSIIFPGPFSVPPLTHTVTDMCDTYILSGYLQATNMLPSTDDVKRSESNYMGWDRNKLYTYDNVMAYFEGGYEESDTYIKFNPMLVPTRRLFDCTQSCTKLPVFHIVPNHDSAIKMFEENLECGSVVMTIEEAEQKRRR